MTPHLRHLLLGAALLGGAVMGATQLGVGVPPARAASTAATTGVGHAATATTATTATTPASDPHGPYDMTSDACASCHRGHTSEAANLLADVAPQSRLCFTCHDGTGAKLDVKAQYTDPKLPKNDPATASYYSHDTLVVTSHTLASSDEFRGVLNRHTECSDCHDPHSVRATPASSSSPEGTAWTVSGRLLGTSGVAVTNGGLGAAPTYTWLNGTASAPVTAEYQLCLKCHSGFTRLLANASGKPSQDMLDAGVEFNPNNTSFHPVEAPGRNQTPKMALSLSAGSPYKLWNLTPASTVRCTMCHANSATFASGPAAGSDLAPHVSSYRGILLQNYQDRVLKAAGDPYASADFALCYLCHTDAPFKGSSNAATNFSLHAMHLTGISGAGDNTGASRDIDTPGAGDGNALCAECHFRPHGTGATAEQNAGLITFAPDVTAFNGVLEWRSTGVGTGQCTLSCHGFDHDHESYVAAP